MRDFMDNAYEEMIDFYRHLLGFVIAMFVFATSPLWIIPYAIYRNSKKKEDPEND